MDTSKIKLIPANEVTSFSDLKASGDKALVVEIDNEKIPILWINEDGTCITPFYKTNDGWFEKTERIWN